jgi:subtilisin family serine protease
MFAEFFEVIESSAYHDGMLLVETLPEPPIAMDFGPPQAADLEASPGLAALSRFESGGFLKRVTPLAHPVSAGPAFGMQGGLEAFFAMDAVFAEQDPLANTRLVELERDSDVDFLQSELARDPSVTAVSRVPIRYLVARRRSGAAAAAGAAIAASAPPGSALWNLNKVRWAEARNLPGFNDARDIRVAVLDSGIDTGHPDLQGRIARYTFAHPDLEGVSSDKDLIGHGTHVAGTIGASINNNIGINGICSAQLHIWKIFDDQPDFSRRRNEFVYFVDPVMYRRALADCLNANVDVINLSIGGPGAPDFVERRLFGDLLTRGVKIVAAMGNERRSGSPTSFPAAIPGVIAVGATSIDDKVAVFSNAGNHITLSAPGVGIWSTLPTYPGQTGFRNGGTLDAPVPGTPFARDTDYASWQGTSMAAPHVSAAVALLLANRGAMDAPTVQQRLMATADRLPGMTAGAHDSNYGAGRLNLFRLLT